MALQTIKQTPIRLETSRKHDLRTQFAALCYRLAKGKPEILLITSRRTRRWIIPKGWPIDGKTPGEIVLTEAWEEAGVTGKAHDKCLGLFHYFKSMAPETGMPCVAMVYPVKVKSLSGSYPEAEQRKRRWMRPGKAAAHVCEPELAHMIKTFDPRGLSR